MESAKSTETTRDRRQTATGLHERDQRSDTPELLRRLGPSRWEPRDEPFQGFGSPPGKF